MKPFDFLKNISDKKYLEQETENIWSNSPFKNINNLKSDYSGKVGELFIKNICIETNIPFIYNDDDKNSKDGTYDIIINEKKIERFHCL